MDLQGLSDAVELATGNASRALELLDAPAARPAPTREEIVAAERQRCIALCEGWIGRFHGTDIRYTSAREYAVDAIEDIIDLIRNGTNPALTGEQEKCTCCGFRREEHVGAGFGHSFTSAEDKS